MVTRLTEEEIRDAALSVSDEDDTFGQALAVAKVQLAKDVEWDAKTAAIKDAELETVGNLLCNYIGNRMLENMEAGQRLAVDLEPLLKFIRQALKKQEGGKR